MVIGYCWSSNNGPLAKKNVFHFYLSTFQNLYFLTFAWMKEVEWVLLLEYFFKKYSYFYVSTECEHFCHLRRLCRQRPYNFCLVKHCFGRWETQIMSLSALSSVTPSPWATCSASLSPARSAEPRKNQGGQGRRRALLPLFVKILRRNSELEWHCLQITITHIHTHCLFYSTAAFSLYVRLCLRVLFSGTSSQMFRRNPSTKRRSLKRPSTRSLMR